MHEMWRVARSVWEADIDEEVDRSTQFKSAYAYQQARLDEILHCLPASLHAQRHCEYVITMVSSFGCHAHHLFDFTDVLFYQTSSRRVETIFVPPLPIA